MVTMGAAIGGAVAGFLFGSLIFALVSIRRFDELEEALWRLVSEPDDVQAWKNAAAVLER